MSDIQETAHPFEGLPNGEERLAKAKIAKVINGKTKERGVHAWLPTGLTSTEIKSIQEGRLSGFSIDDLYSIKKKVFSLSD